MRIEPPGLPYDGNIPKMTTIPKVTLRMVYLLKVFLNCFTPFSGNWIFLDALMGHFPSTGIDLAPL
jgi:hypothetical protein